MDSLSTRLALSYFRWFIRLRCNLAVCLARLSLWCWGRDTVDVWAQVCAGVWTKNGGGYTLTTPAEEKEAIRAIELNANWTEHREKRREARREKRGR